MSTEPKQVPAWVLVVALSAIILAGCAAPDAQVTAADGSKVAAVKCRRSEDAPLGTMIRKDCGTPTPDQNIDKTEFMNALQTPGSIPVGR